MVAPMMAPATPMPMMDPMMGALPPPMPPPTPLYEDLPEPRIGPERDPDERDAPRPKLRIVLEDAEAEKDFHQLRIKQAKEYGEWLSGLRTGYFEEDRDAIISGEVETFRINTLEADHLYRTGTIAGMQTYYGLLGRDVTETEEALAIEDVLYYLRQHELNQYTNATGSQLRWTEPNQLQRFGCLVGLDTVNPDDYACGLDMSLIDPLTVFPVFEGRSGLSEVFRVYEDTVSNVIGNYGGSPGGKEYERIRRKVNGIAGKDASGRTDRGKLVTVTECWNRDWVLVAVDDEEILCRRHGYAEVPFTVAIGGWDLPPGTSAGLTEDAYLLNSAWGEISITDRASDLARQYQPFGWRHVAGHALAEAIAGRHVTNFKNAANPTFIHEVDPMTKELNTGEITARPGHIIEITLGNRLSTLPVAPGAETVAPIQGLLAANAEQGPWSQINAGGIPPQTSDSALGTMLELGGASQGILVSTLEQFIKRRAEARLRRLRDFLPVLGKKGSRGVLVVPSRDDAPGANPVHVLTREMLERVGCEVDVTLFHHRPNPSLIQYLSTAVSAGAISRETMRRKLRIVPDPDREMWRIENEMIDELPAIATQRALRRIDREIASEIEAGDFDNADALMVAGLELEFERQKQMAGGQAAPPPVDPRMAAGAPMGEFTEMPLPSTPPDINQQGLSMPQLGIGVGTQGGRPQGSTQPTQPTPVNTVTAPRRR
jgi:hypothetical protein